MNPAAPTGSELLVVSIDGRPYALPVEVVREVLFVEEAEPAPADAAPSVRSWRGEALPLADVAAALGHPPSAPGSRLVVLERAGARCGVLVGAVDGLRALPVQLSAALADPARAPSPLLSAVALHDGAQVGVLDPEALIALACAGEAPEAEAGAGEDAQQTELLTVGSRGRSWALPLEAVEGIVELSSLATVPRAPPFVRGLVGFRGEILLAIDLAELLDPGGRGFGDLRRVVAITAGGRRLALLVERTVDVFVAPLASFLPGARPALPKASEVAEGVTTFLDPSALVSRAFELLERGG